MHQSLQGATFPLEHIIPRCRGGSSEPENLAWACPSCNLRKSNRVEVQLSDEDEPLPLFIHACTDGISISNGTSIKSLGSHSLVAQQLMPLHLTRSEGLEFVVPKLCSLYSRQAMSNRRQDGIGGDHGWNARNAAVPTATRRFLTLARNMVVRLDGFDALVGFSVTKMTLNCHR